LCCSAQLGNELIATSLQQNRDNAALLKKSSKTSSDGGKLTSSHTIVPIDHMTTPVRVASCFIESLDTNQLRKLDQGAAMQCSMQDESFLQSNTETPQGSQVHRFNWPFLNIQPDQIRPDCEVDVFDRSFWNKPETNDLGSSSPGYDSLLRDGTILCISLNESNDNTIVEAERVIGRKEMERRMTIGRGKNSSNEPRKRTVCGKHDSSLRRETIGKRLNHLKNVQKRNFFQSCSESETPKQLSAEIMSVDSGFVSETRKRRMPATKPRPSKVCHVELSYLESSLVEPEQKREPVKYSTGNKKAFISSTNKKAIKTHNNDPTVVSNKSDAALTGLRRAKRLISVSDDETVLVLSKLSGGDNSRKSPLEDCIIKKSGKEVPSTAGSIKSPETGVRKSRGRVCKKSAAASLKISPSSSDKKSVVAAGKNSSANGVEMSAVTSSKELPTPNDKPEAGRQLSTEKLLPSQNVISSKNIVPEVKNTEVHVSTLMSSTAEIILSKHQLLADKRVSQTSYKSQAVTTNTSPAAILKASTALSKPLASCNEAAGLGNQLKAGTKKLPKSRMKSPVVCENSNAITKRVTKTRGKKAAIQVDVAGTSEIIPESTNKLKAVIEKSSVRQRAQSAISKTCHEPKVITCEVLPQKVNGPDINGAVLGTLPQDVSESTSKPSARNTRKRRYIIPSTFISI